VFALLVVFCNQQVGSLRIMHTAIPNHIKKRFGFLTIESAAFSANSRVATLARSPESPSSSLTGVPGASTMAAVNSSGVLGFRRQRIRQAHSERALQSRQQLHAFQAPNPKSRSKFESIDNSTTAP